MNKTFASIMSVLLLLVLSACGKNAYALAEDSSLPCAADSKTLVVYFSATGSTKRIAHVIAEETGGDLFVLEPVNPYSSEDLDWTADGSRVNLEHDDESLRSIELVSTSVENWDSYDTVFIGYPIWWGIAAWPVNEFIASNDFSGKTVIPFCTSISSGIGESATLLSEMAGTGNWQDGQRFSSSTSDSEITEWLSTLNY
ncbi:MAG: flavodoxin [Clostridia bacterium]|nr:flavodoxin [Clostridia bacterium]